jgi:hypothetical protein
MEPRDQHAADVNQHEWDADDATPLPEPRFQPLSLRTAYPNLPDGGILVPPMRRVPLPNDDAVARPSMRPQQHAADRLYASPGRSTLPKRLHEAATALFKGILRHVRDGRPASVAVVLSIGLVLLVAAGHALLARYAVPAASTKAPRPTETLIARAAPIDCSVPQQRSGCPAVATIPHRHDDQPAAVPPSPSVSLALTEGSGSAAPPLAGTLSVAATLDRPAAGIGDAAPRPMTGAAPRLGPPRLSEIQARLLALGYDVGKVDGRPGRRTVRAVKRFQRDHHIRSDGVLSDAVVAAIMAATPKTRDVRAAQRLGARG